MSAQYKAKTADEVKRDHLSARILMLKYQVSNINNTLACECARLKAKAASDIEEINNELLELEQHLKNIPVVVKADSKDIREMLPEEPVTKKPRSKPVKKTDKKVSFVEDEADEESSDEDADIAAAKPKRRLDEESDEDEADVLAKKKEIAMKSFFKQEKELAKEKASKSKSKHDDDSEEDDGF